MTAGELCVRPLRPDGFAVEITLDDPGGRGEGELREELEGVLARHPVLCIRIGELRPEQLLGITSAFGEPQLQVLREHRLPTHPLVSVISSEQFDTRGGGGRIVFGGAWHTDDSYLPRPALATALYAVVVPPSGGGTLFVDCAAAYDELADELKEQLAEVEVVHCYQSRRNLNAVPTRSPEEEAETPAATHPLVKVHPVTARPALYLNPNRMDHVVGMDLAEGDALLDRLIQHATSERFVHRHDWRLHDLLVWDNRCTMHKAMDDYGTHRRLMHRVLLAAHGEHADG